jgi:hypothetical protein
MSDISGIPYERLEGNDTFDQTPAVSAFLVQKETPEERPGHSLASCRLTSGIENVVSYESQRTSTSGQRKGIPSSKSGLPRETRARFPCCLIFPTFERC